MIPHLEVNPVWQDSRYYMSQPSWLSFLHFSSQFWKETTKLKSCVLCSSFAEIFDVDHFIVIMKNEVSVVKELPSKYLWSTREYYATGIRATRIKTAPVHASANWYIENVLPVLQRFVWRSVYSHYIVVLQAIMSKITSFFVVIY